MSEQTASMGNSRTACQALHNHPRLSNDIWKSCHDLHANGNRLSLRVWTIPQLFWLLQAQRLCECSPTAPSTLVPSGDPFTRRFFLQDLCTSSTGELQGTEPWELFSKMTAHQKEWRNRRTTQLEPHGTPVASNRQP